MAMWWTMYGFSVASVGWNWSGIGVLLLTALFQGSTLLTEKITLEKYPLYREYQKDVSMLLPMPPKSTKAKTY